MEFATDSTMPPRFVDLKREIAASYPNFQERVTNAWVDIIGQLDEVTKVIAKEGSDVSIVRLKQHFFVLVTSRFVEVYPPGQVCGFSQLIARRDRQHQTQGKRGHQGCRR